MVFQYLLHLKIEIFILINVVLDNGEGMHECFFYPPVNLLLFTLFNREFLYVFDYPRHKTLQINWFRRDVDPFATYLLQLTFICSVASEVVQ
jgi:hypothetical protein